MLFCTHSKGNIHFVELEHKSSLVIVKHILQNKINYHKQYFLPDYCIAATQVAAFLYFPVMMQKEN